MRKKNFGIMNFFFSFVIVCIVIYIFKNINGSVETMVANKGVLEDIIKADGIVVKDETAYSAASSGNVTYYREDGEKIKEGILIADLNQGSDSSEISGELAEIEKAIENKKNSGQAASSSDSSSANQSELQEGILNKDLDKVYSASGQGSNQSGGSKYDIYGIAELEQMKSNLQGRLGTSKVSFYSEKSGVVTFKIDGLEDKYSYENVMDIQPSGTDEKESTAVDMKQKTSVSGSDKIFKIISSFDYYIAATMDNEKAKMFEENKYVKTRIISDSSSHEVWGLIKKINYGSERSVLIIYYDDFFHKIYDKRYVDLELITDTHEGIKINSEAVTEKDGMKGVYVCDASNIVKFFPVEILGDDGKTTIVYEGDFVSENQRRIVVVSDKKYDTIKFFDKVILKPEKVHDGQVVE
jgi:putative membrane fusion protein